MTSLASTNSSSGGDEYTKELAVPWGEGSSNYLFINSIFKEKNLQIDAILILY